MPVSSAQQLKNQAHPDRTCDVSVVIVSYNVAALLEECLKSLLEREPDGLSLEIIVVDNASADGSAELARRFPGVRVVENRYNYGFPRGCNQGWRQSNGRYLFFLNPDARLEPGSLGLLVNFLDEHPEAGIVAPQIRFPDGALQPNRRRFPGPGLAFVESTILERYPPFKNFTALKRFKYQDTTPELTHTVDWVVGAAFMVRREVYEELGGMDERYFMYSEELDLCRRVKEQGWKIWYLPTARVTHQEGQSSKQDVPARHINFHTSKLSYFRKFYGRPYAGLLRLFLLATYLFQYTEEWVKLRLGHKPELRRARLAMIRKVLGQSFKPYHSPYPRPAAELDLCLLSAEYYPQPGGVGDYTACLGEALAKAGAGSVRVLTGETGRAGEKANRPGLELPVCKVVRRWNWRSLPAIARHLKMRPASLVNIQYQTGAYGMHPAINFLPLYLRWKFGPERPSVMVTFHDLRVPYLFPKAGPLRTWVNRLLLRNADLALVTNPEDYRQALAWGRRPERLNLLPIGSNIAPAGSFGSPAERAAFRASLGLQETDFAIGYFGLVNHSKGLDTLLEAFSHLRREEPGWKLVIIGGETGETDATNRAYAQELDGLIARLDLAAGIIRTGHLEPEKTSLTLQALDAVALPFRDGASFRRGSLLAPLAHGLPVVTTRPVQEAGPVKDSDLPQLIDGSNVLLVEPENPAALAGALRRLRRDPALGQKLGQAALAVSRYFEWDALAARFLTLLENQGF